MKEIEKGKNPLIVTIVHEINNPNHSILMNAQSQKKIWNSIILLLDEVVREKGKLAIGDYDYEELKKDLLTSIETTINNSRRIKGILEQIEKMSNVE